jgi:hypothetical protein
MCVCVWPEPHTMMPAPGETSETAKLMEMVQKDAPVVSVSARAIAKPEKVANR